MDKSKDVSFGGGADTEASAMVSTRYYILYFPVDVSVEAQNLAEARIFQMGHFPGSLFSNNGFVPVD